MRWLGFGFIFSVNGPEGVAAMTGNLSSHQRLLHPHYDDDI
jgi:hypothetical protein